MSCGRSSGRERPYAGSEHRVCGRRRRGAAGRLAIATDRLGRDRLELRRARRDVKQRRGAVCVSWEGVHRGLLLRALLLSLLLVLFLVDLRLDVRLDVVEQIVLVGDLRGLDLARALRLFARVRDVDPVGLALRIERAMGSVSGSADVRHRMRRSPPGRASPLETPWPRRSSRRRPTQWKAGWGQGVGR